MIVNGAIKKYVSRYVIPFYFDYESDGYSKIIKSFVEEEKDFKALGLPKDCRWVKRGFWENYKTDDTTQPEMDIYTYLLEILKEVNEIEDEMTFEWQYETEEIVQYILKEGVIRYQELLQEHLDE